MTERDALIRSAARNHTSWMTLRAQAAGGGVRCEAGMRWIVSTPGTGASLPFPDEVSAAGADAMLADCRARGASGIGCWTTGLEPIGELAAVLVARGFEWGWQAHWMAWELDAVPRIDDDRVTVSAETLPGTWRAFAPDAGQAVAHVADGEAGIYDVGVEPAYRRTGLGRALTAAALHAAADAGARIATVNATDDGEPLYSSLGARSLGRGQTFWIHRNGLQSPPPPELVAAAESAGRGQTPIRASRDVLAMRLPGNGLGLAHVALLAGHRDAAAWLAASGAPQDALLAYGVGGADRLAAFAAQRAGAIDEPVGPFGQTILHDAVATRDTPLLEAALALGADVAARDRQFKATPLEWARHLGNDEAAALLKPAP